MCLLKVGWLTSREHSVDDQPTFLLLITIIRHVIIVTMHEWMCLKYDVLDSSHESAHRYICIIVVSVF